MISRDDALNRPGRFWRELCIAVQDGVRDLRTGFDRMAYDWFDPRVEGGLSLDFVLARALSSFWRTPEGVAPHPVVVLAGRFEGGRLQVREVGVDQWPRLESIHLAADGPVAVGPGDSLVRRLRVDEGREALEQLFEAGAVPGDLTVVCGLLGAESKSYLLEAAIAQTGMEGPGAVVLMLYQPNAGPVDIQDSGGPMRNGWHPGLRASQHMSDSHLSAAYLRLISEESKEAWYDQGFRDQLFAALQPAAASRNLQLTHRAFLDALAEGSPLRRVLPYHLTRSFPEAERVFWCVPAGGLDGIDPLLWDPSSPLERLALLSQMKATAAG